LIRASLVMLWRALATTTDSERTSLQRRVNVEKYRAIQCCST
jgi:hypothetical protein